MWFILVGLLFLFLLAIVLYFALQAYAAISAKLGLALVVTPVAMAILQAIAG